MGGGRIVIVVVGAIGGIAAIYFAIQSLQDKPTLTEPSAQDTPDDSGLRTVGVRMEDIEFVPQRVSVRTGQRIRWINKDQTTHTVTKVSGPGPDFDSGEIGANGKYEQTPLDRGVIEYKCSIHPDKMRGRISVVYD